MDEVKPARRLSLFAVTVIAAAITAAIGVVAESLGDGRRVQAHEQLADDQARDQMLTLGWRPTEPSTVVGGVEVLRARGGFELMLGHGVISGDSATDEQRDRATRWVREELGRYPAHFLAFAQLRRVVLCGSLREDRRPIPSLPNYNNTLLLDADAEEAYLRRLIHHEIFHFVDLADDGSVLRDDAWEALNEPEFRYGFGGRAMRDVATAPHPTGFVSGYATAALEEDKAETFAEMMWAPAAAHERALGDAVLQAKIERMRQMTEPHAPGLWTARAAAP